MKPQKLADNIDLKEKKPSNLKNNRGFSLIELMVTSAIGLVVCLGIASVFAFAMEQFTVLVEKNAAEESTLNVAFYLRKFLGQGVDVYAGGLITPGVNWPGQVLPAGGGRINVNYDSLTPTSWGGAGDTGEFGIFAYFNREAGIYNTATGNMPVSTMKTTAIYVKDTDAAALDPDSKSSALIFDYNSNGGIMIPDPSDLVFTRLHQFRVQRYTAANATAACPAGSLAAEVVSSNGRILSCVPSPITLVPASFLPPWKIKTITLEVTTRSFKNTPKSAWNYRAPLGAATLPYNDILQTIKINFKDNVLTNSSLTGGSSEERVFGSLYFYNYIISGVQ